MKASKPAIYASQDARVVRVPSTLADGDAGPDRQPTGTGSRWGEGQRAAVYVPMGPPSPNSSLAGLHMGGVN